MIQYIKTISFVFLSVVVIFATGGINIYKHYCICTGQTIQSVFNPSVDCEHEETEHACNIENELAVSKHACCSAELMAPLPGDQNSCNDEHQCCDDEYYFFKTDQFDYSKSVKKSFEFVAAYQVILNFNNTDDKNYTGGLPEILDNSPPPSYGFNLLKELKQLKIAIPLTA